VVVYLGLGDLGSMLWGKYYTLSPTTQVSIWFQKPSTLWGRAGPLISMLLASLP
jgi:hypothetical protein